MKNQVFHGLWIGAAIIGASLSAAIYKHGEAAKCTALAHEVVNFRDGSFVKALDFQLTKEWTKRIEYIYGKTVKECGGYYPD